MPKNRIPRYNSILFLILPIVIYISINSSLAGTLFLKEIVEYGSKLLNIESFENIEIPKLEVTPEEWIKENYTRNIVIAFLLIGIVISLFNLPFKIYFERKRKGKKINRFISHYTLRLINFTPEIISLFFAGGVGYIHFSLFMLLKKVQDNSNLHSLLFYMLIISIFTSFLALLLIFFGQKYRVQTKYIHHVFTEKRLKRMPSGFNFPRLQGRFFISTIFITLIPLTIVLFYFIFGLKSINSISTLTPDQIEFLYGDMLELLDIISGTRRGELLSKINSSNRLYYMDAFGTLQFFMGVIPGLLISLVYILKVVTWSNKSILIPIRELIKSMKSVSKGNLDSYTVVRSREETGQLAHGFNQMLDGLKDRDRIKSLFGQYLSAEVSEEILKGNVDLNGSIYQATILFADIRGFTSISENQTPAETISFLNDYYNVMIDVVQEYGGIIDKFLGDGILVLFGIPISSTDHADRAVAAAMEMQNRLKQFNSKRKVDGKAAVNIGIGIHTGEVIAGNVGNSNKLEYTVIGDTVNVASRIESLTKQFDTKLLIGESVYTNLSKDNASRNDFEKIEGVSLKGKRLKVNLLKMK